MEIRKKERIKNGIKIGKKSVIRQYSFLWWVIKLLPIAIIIGLMAIDQLIFGIMPR